VKHPLSSIMGCSRRVADAKRDHSVDPNKMVCAHDPDPDQVRNLLGWRQSTRCRRCDARLERGECERCDGDQTILRGPRGIERCPACDGSGFGPWRDAI
jgi:NAD-dependent SIR2 family protein deacetylase